MKTTVVPLWEGRSRALNSVCRIIINLLHNKDHREGEAQYIKGIKRIPNKVEVQFKGKLNLEEGSKIENKLVIIFRIFLSFYS